MSRRLTWRQRWARRLDPTIADVPARRVIDATTAPVPPQATQPPQTPPPQPAHEDRGHSVWPAICEQFALRILASAYQMGAHLEAAEADEQDEDKLEKLYRIDHANTRIRRQAENLQVLLGRKVDDADRQVTPLLDVIRAATSAIEYYSRVQIGHVVDLAVVEFAADDVIRALTELLDNATRFSPPTSPVIVSAYITEHGSVLVRIEDSGLGVKPEQLAPINAMLAGSAPPAFDGNPASHLGLIVVSRLAVANQMRVHLTNRQSGGTTANVLVPDSVLCETAVINRVGVGAAPPDGMPHSAHPARPVRPTYRTPEPSSPYQSAPPPTVSYLTNSHPTNSHQGSSYPGNSYQGSAQVPGAHLMLINGEPSADGGRSSRRESGSSNGLPRRVRESLRGESGSVNGTGTPSSSSAPQPRTSPETTADRELWPDETADFAAGISDALRSPTNDDSEGNPR